MYKIITDIQTGELFMPGRLEFGILIDELPKAMNLVEKKGRITGLAEEVGKWWKARGEFFKRIYDKLYCKRFRERHGPNSCCSHYNLGPWEIYKDGSSFKEDQAAIEIKNEEIRKRRKKDKTKEPLEESLIDYASRIIAQNEDEPKKEPEIVERVTSTGSLT